MNSKTFIKSTICIVALGFLIALTSCNDTTVKPGDRIHFVKYAVVESGLYEDGKKIDMLRERNIELIIYDE